MKPINIKYTLGIMYLVVLAVVLYFVFNVIDIGDFTDYTFIKENRDLIINYKNNNFNFLVVVFFICTILWIFFLGFGLPPALLAGFLFGKWLGTIILISAFSIGASILYIVVRIFFSSFIKKQIEPKISKFIIFFRRNDLLYFTCFRLLGGGGIPFPIQNVIPVIFNMSLPNYFKATFIGIIPSSFITVALGSGIEKIIEENLQLSISLIIFSPEIYLPLLGFVAILLCSFFLKDKIFKGN
ncbi:MAG: hypothetical protein CBC24_00530 [Candidatus Pelagibacter sp. TMED64]|nr:DedA family protein [Candidatus Pelagibacter sp.]OUU67718.1 MAG: hypothetical protein CBC24_00530 [Candidatus Pelagibacter sp. TMED64]|tara:strand:+ start:1006 stop:1728 length:723 start_codon:yes stop_codon:yes gene_type:complete